MGMFDYVKYEAPCWKCGTSLTEFQSKDHNCVLQRVSVRKVRRFYTSCPSCKAWNEYKVKVESYTVKRVRQVEEDEEQQ